MNRIPKTLLFGAFGAIGCLIAALVPGEVAYALLWPRSARTSASVDVMFVLDTTSSMQPAIDGVRRGIIDFAQELSNRNLDARVGLIAYGDEFQGQEPRVLRFGDEPFTGDYPAFREQVGRLRADGGGDIPESTLDALALAAEQPFRPRATKVLLLITDAPPKVPDRSVRSVEEVGRALKAAGIDQLHLVCTPWSRDLSYGALQRWVAGEFFELKDSSRGETEFSSVLPKIGTRIAEISAGLISHDTVREQDQGQTVVAMSVWTALLAAGIGLALIAGQNLYLHRPWMTRREALKGGIGSIAAGLAAGGAGQWLALELNSGWFLLDAITNTLGWVLLGAVVGPGMSLFVRNLSPRRTLIGGVLGGFVAKLGFVISSAILGAIVGHQFGDFAGRQIGAALLGFCIGVMIAWVEAAYRSFWLEVSYGPREVRKVNLGDSPVSIGSNSAVCTVWIPRAAPVDCTYLLRGQALRFTDASGQTTEVGPGFRHTVDSVEVLVRASAGSSPAPAAVRPPVIPPRPAPVPTPIPTRPVPAPAPIPDHVTAPIPTGHSPEIPKATPADRCPRDGYQVAGLVGRRLCMICGEYF
jgi:Ca-activated chloride channel homolog